MGLALTHPDNARPRRMAYLSPPQGKPQLRWRARLEYRVAARSRHRRGGLAHDNARHLLAIPAGFQCDKISRHYPALHLPEGDRRFLSLERSTDLRMRRHRKERIPQQTKVEGRALRRGAI